MDLPDVTPEWFPGQMLRENRGQGALQYVIVVALPPPGWGGVSLTLVIESAPGFQSLIVKKD